MYQEQFVNVSITFPVSNQDSRQYYFCVNSLKEYGIITLYIDIEQIIVQVMFTISLYTWGYISLGDPT